MTALRTSRRRRRTFAAVAVSATILLSTVGGCARGGASLPRLREGDSVLAFGDSLTYGTGAGAAESYPAQLEVRIGLSVVNEGIPGETTAGGLARLPAALERHRPRLLLLCLGGNDFLRGEDPARTEENLRLMVRIAKERGVSVLLIAVPSFRPLAGPPAFYRRIAEDLDVPCEDEVLDAVLREPALKSDAIHPNARGYGRMAERLADALREAGAIGSSGDLTCLPAPDILPKHSVASVVPGRPDRSVRSSMAAEIVVHLVIPSDVRLVDVVHGAAERMAELAGFSEDEALSAALAVREAVINAVKHGNREDPALTVEVALGADGNGFRASVRDRGRGFDPGDAPDPTAEGNRLKTNGRGMLLIRSFVDEVRFRFVQGQGMEVDLIKNRRAGSAA